MSSSSCQCRTGRSVQRHVLRAERHAFVAAGERDDDDPPDGHRGFRSPHGEIVGELRGDEPVVAERHVRGSSTRRDPNHKDRATGSGETRTAVLDDLVTRLDYNRLIITTAFFFSRFGPASYQRRKVSSLLPVIDATVR